MNAEALIEQMTSVPMEGRFTPLLPGLGLSRSVESYELEGMIYEPLVCLILQGQKETRSGGRTAVVRAGQCIIVSHDLPVFARVREASVASPYLALVASIDVAELRSLHHELGAEPTSRGPSSAFEITPVDGTLLSVFARYAALATDPEAARVLLPLVRRELHYRLLKADRGGMLRELLVRHSHASNISRAIRTLREAFRERLEMDALARSVGMSPSSFYKHFKAVTSTTPLQYQKDLRLTEAQRLLRGGDHTVSTAAFAVGYESASQFSREYSRKFGRTPRQSLG